jgi:hypothetical protein
MFYGTAAEFVTYHESRGRTVTALWDDATIEAALLVASEWVDAIYGPSFVGHKTLGFLQEREWPRISATVKGTGYWGEYYIFPDTTTPEEVKKATYEAAYREATEAGFLQKDYTPPKYKSVDIDGAVSVEYVQFSDQSETQTKVAVVETLLWPLLERSAPGQLSPMSGGSVRT